MKRCIFKAASVAVLAALTLTVSPGHASPGAHGPNGEHLDESSNVAKGVGAIPRMEARSETFELVGRLAGGEFTIMINRFETGEPVLAAKVEVESGKLKASTSFHEDMGDYATNDKALLEALATPGEHPIVVTVIAGSDADLLEGTLKVTTQAPRSLGAGAPDHGHDHDSHDDAHAHGWSDALRSPRVWIFGLAALGLSGWAVARGRRASALATNKNGGDAR